MKGPAEIAHGPLLIGFIFNVLLFGIMITQVYLYMTTFKKDPRWIKYYVLLLFLADGLNVIFMFIYTYNALVIHFDDVKYLARANWVFATDPAMTAIIGSMVQFFFAFRVRVLVHRLWPVVTIALLAFAALICGIATSVAIGFVPLFQDFQKFKIPVMIWLFSAAIADVIITTVLVDYLRKHRTGYQKTDDKLEKLMRLTIQTGMITSIWAIVDCVVYLADPTGTHLIFNVPLSKLYSNSMMSTLNARGQWSKQPPISSGQLPSARRMDLLTTSAEARRQSTMKTSAAIAQVREPEAIELPTMQHKRVDSWSNSPGPAFFPPPGAIGRREIGLSLVDQPLPLGVETAGRNTAELE
ncbi:hypothetical protein DL96DRAFT_941061 [Flagelloscypha sp. PMI_526]|nr:hypothetical protein DL96DRAFT_941061 [Flagelloscypha sp. PMI_526]